MTYIVKELYLYDRFQSCTRTMNLQALAYSPTVQVRLVHRHYSFSTRGASSNSFLLLLPKGPEY